MMNTGHSVIFNVENDTRHHINVTGGPLSYKYQFQEIHVHYGLHDQFGSEHSINGYAFPAEVSLIEPREKIFGAFEPDLIGSCLISKQLVYTNWHFIWTLIGLF